MSHLSRGMRVQLIASKIQDFDEVVRCQSCQGFCTADELSLQAVAMKMHE